MEYNIIETELENLEVKWDKFREHFDTETELNATHQTTINDFIKFLNRILSVNKKCMLDVDETVKDVLGSGGSRYHEKIGLNKAGLGFSGGWRANLENITDVYNFSVGCLETINKLLNNEKIVEQISKKIKKEHKEIFEEVVEYFKEETLLSKGEYALIGSELKIEVDNGKIILEFNGDLGELREVSLGSGYRGLDVRLRSEMFNDNDHDGEEALLPISKKCSTWKIEEVALLQLTLNNEQKIRLKCLERDKQVEEFMERVKKFDDFFRPKLNMLEAVDNL